MDALLQGLNFTTVADILYIHIHLQLRTVLATFDMLGTKSIYILSQKQHVHVHISYTIHSIATNVTVTINLANPVQQASNSFALRISS